MHLFFFIRGISQQVALYKALAQGFFFKWKRTNLTNNQEEYSLVQGALRESVFGAYEYIFPEEALPDVLASFGITEENYSFKDNARLSFIRKIFGAYAIPKKALKEAKKIPTSIMLNDSFRGLSALTGIPGVTLHPIGLKKDRYGEMVDPGRDNLKFYQELL